MKRRKALTPHRLGYLILSSRSGWLAVMFFCFVRWLSWFYFGWLAIMPVLVCLAVCQCFILAGWLSRAFFGSLAVMILYSASCLPCLYSGWVVVMVVFWLVGCLGFILSDVV